MRWCMCANSDLWFQVLQSFQHDCDRRKRDEGGNTTVFQDHRPRKCSWVPWVAEEVDISQQRSQLLLSVGDLRSSLLLKYVL